MKKLYIFTLLINFCLLGSAEVKNCFTGIQKSQTKHYPFGYFYFMPKYYNFTEEELSTEIWLPIKNTEGKHLVSNLGRVTYPERTQRHLKTNFTRTIKGGIFCINLDSYGYPIVGIVVNGKKVSKTVHRLVAEAFIPNPENKPTVNHKFGIKTDNRASQLEWFTVKEQTVHSWNVLGRVPFAGKEHPRWVPVYKYTISGQFVMKYECISYAAQELNIGASGMLQTCNGVNKIRDGFVWSLNELDSDFFKTIKILPSLKSRRIKATNENGDIRIYNSKREAEREHGSKHEVTYSLLHGYSYKGVRFEYVNNEAI